MFLENKTVDERISRAIDNDHTAAMKAPGDNRKHMRKKGSSSYNTDMITVCMLCQKAFKSSIFYRKHLRLHSDKAPSCPICGKVFARKTHLQAHLQNHHKGGSFQCPLCPRRFPQKATLNQHMKLHASPKKCSFRCEERPFECELCHKRFNIKSSLQRHMSCHTGEKPFLCGICNRGYTRRSVLVLHIQQVHENRKPFQCDECHLCFSQKGNLQAHFRRKHLQPKGGEGRKGKGSARRGFRRQRAKKAVEEAKTRPRMDNTSMHSYASKVKAIVNRGARNSQGMSSSSTGGFESNGESYSSTVNICSLESNSSCSLSDEAAASSSGSDDIPEQITGSLGFPAILESPSDDIKTFAEFESLLDLHREWDEDYFIGPDNLLLPHYDLSDNLSAPTKSNMVLTTKMNDDPFSTSTWNDDYPLFTADDLEDIRDISSLCGMNSNTLDSRISDTELRLRVGQNSKTVSYPSFSLQKINFAGSSLQA